MKVALLNLHSTRRKVRCILSPRSLDACAKGSVYLCSYPVGGSTYCSVGALSLLGKWPISSRGSFTFHDKANDERKLSAKAMRDTVRYLAFRQVPFQCEEDEDDEENENQGIQALGQQVQHMQVFPAYGMMTDTFLSYTPGVPVSHPTSSSKARVLPALPACAGLNGRCNKVADTCYSWWAGGSLSVSPLCADASRIAICFPTYLLDLLIKLQMLSKFHLLDVNASRRFLLDKTQHIIGGFGKLPGEPPGKLLPWVITYDHSPNLTSAFS